jgi:hypothetical protein
VVAQGCKEGACNSDQAAFAINVVTGKGMIVVKENPGESDSSLTRAYQWAGQFVSGTPQAIWAQENGSESGVDAPIYRSKMRCRSMTPGHLSWLRHSKPKGERFT